MADAIRIFKAHPGIHVYLDAGNARWLPPEQIAAHLNAAGVDYADGFSLNVSNYVATDETLAFGKKVSALTGGAVIHVSLGRSARNGCGENSDGEERSPEGSPKPFVHVEAPTINHDNPMPTHGGQSNKQPTPTSAAAT